MAVTAFQELKPVYRVQNSRTVCS